MRRTKDRDSGISPVSFANPFVRAKPSICPVCERTSSKVKLFVEDNDTKLTVLACKCGSLFYPGAKAPDYEIVENRTSFFMRIDQAEGIDSAAMPLFASPDLDSFSVVDIGCGLGFTSAYVRFLGRECKAFDPSSAARLSTEYLGIEVSREYATVSNTETKKEKLVFASEVIEHVDDPLQFLKLLKEITGDTGYAIVTTPNAEYVQSNNPKNTILAMLAPSQHLFLLSKSSLSELAKGAGFSWIHAWTQAERLFLIAGPKEITLSNSFSRLDFIAFLENQLQDEKIGRLFRYRSYGYRLFKEYVHSSRYVEAEKLLTELSIAYSKLGMNLYNPTSIVELLIDATGEELSIPDPELFPYNLALLMYLQGTLQIAYFHDREVARPFFVAAIEISDLYRRVFTNGIFQAYDLELQSVKGWALDAMKLHKL
jgi:2-polyprenyl-3-methyl-5-hydroxy-6-metoxy-1,4-benzoquinol methylase